MIMKVVYPSQNVSSTARHQHLRWRTSTPAVFVTMAVLGLLAFLHIPWHSPRLFAASCPHTDLQRNSTTYPGERISWKPCRQLINRTLECSTIDVPMDQFNVTNSGNKTFSIPLIRLRGRNATQNLILNPGGPGGSGLSFMYRAGEQLNTIVGEGFHLLSFDPRGVNNSIPFATCYPEGEPGTAARREHTLIHGGAKIEDAGEIYAWSSNYAKACLETMGIYGEYINTPQTAADMNSILDAVGQDDMVYWGFSYGTLLGQTYAAIFPERSKRVIIDGVANLFDWYDSLLDEESLIDTENVLDGFLSECVSAGPKCCSLASVGNSGSDIKTRLLDLLSELDEEPLSIYLNNTYYGLLTTEKVLINGIFPPLYKPAIWPELAPRLAKLLSGNATDFFLAYGMESPWNLAGESNHFVMLNDGASGPSYWPKGRSKLLEILRPLLNSTLFGPAEVDSYYFKQQWAVPKTHHFAPKRPGSPGWKGPIHTAHPLLILTTTYDPVCPLISARSANAAFGGSQIVEIQGYGHCSIAVPSQCGAHAIRAFLYEGKLPDKYKKCEVDGSYFPNPDEDGTLKSSSTVHFEDEGERQLHEAQVALARDWVWTR